MSEEEVLISKEEQDRILAEKLMEKLNSEKGLGFTWSSNLEFLFNLGYITETEYEQNRERYLDSTKTAVQRLKEKAHEAAVTEDMVRCNNCGKKINSGTYGMIFNSNTDNNKVIKGSIQSHSEAHGCPENFTREFERYNEIKTVFPSDLNLVSLLNITDEVWVEKRRCYFSTEKLHPINFNRAQLENLHEKIRYAEENSQSDMKFIFTQIKDVPRLYMLVPGIQGGGIYFNEGGNGGDGWREINEPIMKILFEILGFDINDYYRELVKILKATMENGIYLIDVEFILCSTNEPDENGELIRKNKIVMIDFDKVERGPINNTMVRNKTLNQDMFTNKIKTEIESPAPAKAYVTEEAAGQAELGGKNKKLRKNKKSKTRKNKKSKTRKNKKSKTRKNKRFKTKITKNKIFYMIL